MRKLEYTIAFIILCIIVVIMLFPLLMVALNSFKTEVDLLTHGPFAMPEKFTLDVIKEVWHKVGFSEKFMNSLVISVSVSALSVCLSLVNGFAISVLRIKRGIVFLFLFMLGMMIPQESLLYPLYYIFRKIGLYNTRLSLILILTGLHTSYGTYLVSNVLKTFPKSYIEAARLDGAGNLYILRSIVMPLSKPVLAVLMVFTFIWTWNDFLLSLVFLISNKIQTMPLALVLLQGQQNVVYTMRSAASLITAIPCVLFFLIFQRTISRGVVSSGLKG